MSIARILELYARRGISLLDNGLCEAALPLEDARDAIGLFAKQKWHVLGGDIYRLTPQNFLEPTYENWFYDGGDWAGGVDAASEFIGSVKEQKKYVVFVIRGD